MINAKTLIANPNLHPYPTPNQKPSHYTLTLMPWSHLCVKPPRMSHVFGIWGDTWLTRGKYGIYVAVRGSYGALTGST